MEFVLVELRERSIMIHYQGQASTITFFKHNYIMHVLELFSGMGSVGNVCKAIGMDVVSLDRDMPADIRSDIVDWDYKDV